MRIGYAECGFRFLMLEMPRTFDDWGWEKLDILENRIERVLEEFGHRSWLSELVLRERLMAEIQRKPKQWEHSFCVIDDFGDAVPVNPFPHMTEGHEPYLGPDYANPPEIGQQYKYILFYPNIF